MLSNAEIEEVKNIVKKHILAFVYGTLGPDELSTSEIKILEDAGLLDKTGKKLIEDSYLFGKISSLIGPTTAASMSVEQVKRAVSKLSLMTDIEKEAINYAKASAGQYIKGIGDMMIKDATSLISRSSNAALRAVQDGVSEAIANRDTINQLRSDLFNIIDNRESDWQRIAHTEINTAIQHGIYNDIRKKSSDGANQLVYKLPSPDACKYCKALYLKDDGITPRVFRLIDLANTNIGLKAINWKAVIGSTHPWCGCLLIVIPDGMDFVKKKRVKADFEFGGKKYKVGSIITDKEYDSFSVKEKDKLEDGVSLSYTGETAKLDTKKSMSKLFPNDFYDTVCEC